jgi:hypothetical protein
MADSPLAAPGMNLCSFAKGAQHMSQAGCTHFLKFKQDDGKHIIQLSCELCQGPNILEPEALAMTLHDDVSTITSTQGHSLQRQTCHGDL